MFVESTSFILRAAVGGAAGAKGGSGKSARKAAAKTGPPLWDPKKLEVGDNFSCVSYLNVTKIEANQVTVNNHQGGSWIMSKDLLVKDALSADHFEKEVKCNMTDMSEILEMCRDTIFKVSFKKKIDQKAVEQKLSEIKFADLKKPDAMKKISKSIVEGEVVELCGHLLSSENNLGRSLVIDLNAPQGKGFRQIDHRTIEYIIFKNVKYTVGKKAADTGELPLKPEKGKPNWNESKLAVGNWFSSITYYKIKSITDKDNVQVVTCDDSKKELTMSRDILEYEMHSGLVFEKEEKVSRTEMIEHLVNAKESVMTVKFHKKVDDAYVKEILSSATQAQLKDAKKLKELGKELVGGKECEMTCHLTSSDGKLGRSRCMDLNAPHGMNYRQIDHRTVQSLILKNIKYVAK